MDTKSREVNDLRWCAQRLKDIADELQIRGIDPDVLRDLRLSAERIDKACSLAISTFQRLDVGVR